MSPIVNLLVIITLVSAPLTVLVSNVGQELIIKNLLYFLTICFFTILQIGVGQVLLTPRKSTKIISPVFLFLKATLTTFLQFLNGSAWILFIINLPFLASSPIILLLIRIFYYEYVWQNLFPFVILLISASFLEALISIVCLLQYFSSYDAVIRWKIPRFKELQYFMLQ
jgi:hypothetical protein